MVVPNYCFSVQYLNQLADYVCSWYQVSVSLGGEFSYYDIQSCCKIRRALHSVVYRHEGGPSLLISPPITIAEPPYYYRRGYFRTKKFQKVGQSFWDHRFGLLQV